MKNKTSHITVAWRLLTTAWIISLIATLSAIYIGEVMGQTPCTLCWYQRICMFPLVLILGAGSFNNEPAVIKYSLPLALAGLAIAGYHSMTYAGIIPAPLVPCGQGVSCSGAEMTLLGVLPLPYLSSIAFITITLCLLVYRASTRNSENF